MAIFKSYFDITRGYLTFKCGCAFPKKTYPNPNCTPNFWAIGWIFYGPNVRVVAQVISGHSPILKCFGTIFVTNDSIVSMDLGETTCMVFWIHEHY